MGTNMTAKRQSEFGRARRHLLSALHALRHTTREVGSNYLATLQAEIVSVERAVRKTTNGDSLTRKQLMQLHVMLKAINDLDVEPRKGRRRDLKKIDRVMSQIVETTCEW